MASRGKGGATKASVTAKAKASATGKAKSKAAATAKPEAAGLGAHAQRFERAPYELPVMDLAEAVELANALLAAKPGKAAPAIAEEAARVAAARDRAKAVAKTAGGGAAAFDARAYDVAMDRAWATFVRRMQDYAELPAAPRAAVPEAGKIYALVSDLSILKLNYLAEFAQIGARLDALKREGLLDDARRLAGAPFLDEVLRCHGEYGQALGVLGGPEATGTADRGEARLALVEAIGEYAVQVMGLARAGRHSGWAPVHKALKPIAALRARRERALREPARRAAPAPHPPVEVA